MPQRGDDMIKLAEVINEQGEPIAYELTMPDDEVFFFEHSQERFEGLRIGKFPRGSNGEYERRLLFQHDVHVAVPQQNIDTP